MAKTYKILVNDGKGTDIKPVSVVQGTGEKGEPVRMVAKRGWRFELQDEIKGRDLAPDQVRVKRMGKNLGVMFDGSKNSDVVIEDFYADNTDADKDNGMPTLVGLAENGGMYEYVPQDPAASSMPGTLKDGNTPVIVSLGGGPLTGDFVLAGLPLVAAAGGGLGGWLAGGALVAAAAAGGGKGGGSSSVVLPSGQTGHLTHDALNDTGASITDGYTKNNKPQLTINAEHGATVVVNVNGKDYNAVETSTSGIYTVDVGSKETQGKLSDGVYTPVIKVTNTAGTSSANGEAFTVDSSSDNNQPNNQPDPNNSATVTITAISEDTGGDATDFITSDTALLISGKVTGFTTEAAGAGERLHVRILDGSNKVVAEEYVSPSTDGTWTTIAPTAALQSANYTINAAIEDAAGNIVKAVTHSLTITDIPSGQTGFIKHDAANDTGISQTDSITNNQNPTYTGVADKGAAVEVVINGVIYHATASATDGTYSFAVINNGAFLQDGVYTSTVKSTLNGNSSTVAGTPFTVDHSAVKNQPNNQDDPNKDATIEILAVSDDTGTRANDFVTTDTTVIVNGKVTGFSNTAIAAGERVHVQILDGTNVVAEEYVVPAADGKWTMSAPTAALAKATYNIKATIEDIAGNEVKLANQTLVIADAYVKANADTNAVTEDATNLIVNGGLIAGGLNGVGADEATSVQMGALKVSQVKADAGSYVSIGANGQTTINGVYGTLKVMADGTYSYELRNSDANVQALHNTQATDTFTYTLSDGLGHTSVTTLTVTINGQNDVPTFLGRTTKQISQTGPGLEGDQLVISDLDQGESFLAIGTVGTEYKGQYGTFKIEETTTSGTYNWTYIKPNKDLGSSDAIRHELFVVKSLDGTASQTIDVSVDSGSQALTKQEFHALTADGLKVAGSSATTDTLVMHGSGVFDFTQALSQITSVERLDADPAHTASNTVKLNITSLTQADGHVLTVLGDATDSVIMIGSSFTSKTQITTGSMAGFTDYKYLAANNDELHLFVQSVMNQTGI
jgi:VCBS repeat-containing protein